MRLHSKDSVTSLFHVLPPACSRINDTVKPKLSHEQPICRYNTWTAQLKLTHAPRTLHNEANCHLGAILCDVADVLYSLGCVCSQNSRKTLPKAHARRENKSPLSLSSSDKSMVPCLQNWKPPSRVDSRPSDRELVRCKCPREGFRSTIVNTGLECQKFT